MKKIKKMVAGGLLLSLICNSSASIVNATEEQNLSAGNFTSQRVSEDDEFVLQKISDGWTQDGWYYYINGEPVKGIVEIGDIYYYFDENIGKLCKKAQWIEQNGRGIFVI